MIWSLIKINLLSIFSGMINRYKKSRKTKPAFAVLIGLLIVYIVGTLFISIGALFRGLAGPFFDGGIGWFYFAFAGLLVFALCFIGTIFMIGAQIFNARDNELLLSMPIKPSAVLTGRLLALLVIEYAYELLILVPVFAVLVIYGRISLIPIAGIIFFFISVLLLPLLSLAVASLFGWIISLISSRLRRKNIITLILSLGFLTVYMVGYYKMMGYMNELVERGMELASAVRRAIFPAYHLGAAIANGSFVSFLIFALCAVVPFLIMCVLLSASFVKITTSARGPKRVEYRERTLRASKAGAALLKREIGNFLASPMYIINASLGAIVTLAAAAVLIVRPSLITGSIEQFALFIPQQDFSLIGAVALAALAALNFVSAPTLSLEGKTLWIVKSLPVTARTILMSKAGLHLIICGLPTLLAGIVCIIRLPVTGALPVVLTILLPAVVTLTFSLIGVTLNLSFPRFDWVNPIQPIKQGLSAMLSMFGGMALILVLVLVYILSPASSLSLDIYLLICTVFFIAASAALALYLDKSGTRKFEAL